MAVAMLYPEPEKGGRGKKSGIIPGFLDSGSVSHARMVLAILPQSADVVIAGTLPLPEVPRVPVDGVLSNWAGQVA